jgi:putative transcriptional regulator
MANHDLNNPDLNNPDLNNHGLESHTPKNHSLKGEFLVSMPALKGDYFRESVIFLIEHNEEGAFGLVINKPVTIALADILPQLEDVRCNVSVLEGGPVEQDRIFFLHTPDKQYEASLPINPEISLTTSPDLIADLARGDSPEKIIAIIGYAGWGGAQLEGEIVSDAWLVTPFDSRILFSDNHTKKPQQAASKMGVDINLIGPTSGHG